MNVTERAIEHARRWYPLGEIQIAEEGEAEATVVVLHEESTYLVHYLDLDAREGQTRAVCGTSTVTWNAD